MTISAKWQWLFPSMRIIVLLAVCTAMVWASGCTRKLTEGKFPPSTKHVSVADAEARVVLSQLTDTNVTENARSAVDNVFSQHPGGPVVLVHLRLSGDEQLWKSLREKNPGLTRFSEQDYYGLVDGVRTDPLVPQGITEVINGNNFVQQDIVFPVSDHVKELDVVLKGVSLAKFSF